MKVNITDKAIIDNETKRSRSTTEDSGVTNFFGKGKVPLMNAAVPTRILTADSNVSNDGKGSVNRSEALQTNVAAVVTQVLPNGNLVIEGKQEIRVNFEIRELIVAGIVRPEDIESDNTIDSTKIAQARIAYGGRGQITDVQQHALRPAGVRCRAAVLTRIGSQVSVVSSQLVSSRCRGSDWNRLSGR